MGGVQDRQNDAWEWDGTAWHQIVSPPFGSRDHHMMVYDEARGRAVLFGGAGPNESLATDTWEWDGTTWTRAATDGPPGRAHFGMAYDSANRRVLIVGGLSRATSGSGYRALSDTWAWDGVRWTPLAEAGLTPRTHFRIAFDRRVGRIVLFGGMADGRLGATLGDTWLFDERAWSRSPAAGPAPRTGAMIAYDERRNRTVLVGGGAYDGKTATRFDDTWEWNGSEWSEVR